MGVWRIVLTCAVLGGCFPVSIGMTRDQQLDSAVIGTRVTSQRADLEGTQCYVDQRTRARIKKHVPLDARIFAGLEILGGGLVALFGPPALYVGLPIAFDGLLAVVYIKATDGKEVVRTSWEPSNETASCRR